MCDLLSELRLYVNMLTYICFFVAAIHSHKDDANMVRSRKAKHARTATEEIVDLTEFKAGQRFKFMTSHVNSCLTVTDVKSFAGGTWNSYHISPILPGPVCAIAGLSS